MAEALTVVF